MKLMLVKAYAEQHGQPQKSDKTEEQASKKTKSAIVEKKDLPKKDQEQGSQSPFGLVMFHFM
mgnify:CR=1 FL=1